MTVLRTRRPKASSNSARSARLFLLELNADRIHSMNPDGSDRKTVVTDCHLPDGIVDAIRKGSRALSPSCGVGLAPFSSMGDAFAEQRPSSRDLVDAPCEEARLSPQDQIECERVS